MAETMFPQRQRCKKCRGGFTTDVLNGLYCSYKCAVHPLPAKDPAKAPRECAYERDGKAVFKRRFRCESEIPESISSKPDVSIYRCSHCLYLHTGTAVARTVKAQKSVGSMEELSEVLVKARGKATRTTVGNVAGIRPIRIKEIEEGADRIDPEALFALLKLYRISLAVGFR
ncbi:MAG: hypothetical protein E6R04_03000 [Spirochaetes bacterium]|nr:MAG: hypothetical protein E6R04_03000 [Spirochaetota bacterium]